jgi:hypothetical protein
MRVRPYLALPLLTMVVAVAGYRLAGPLADSGLRDRLDAIITPAPLSAAHRTDPEIDSCLACHSLWSPLDDAACLECHEEIAALRSEGVGYHGAKLTGPCASCHAEHHETILDFDREAFNHRQARYPLHGRHLLVECEQCHQTSGADSRFTFTGLAFDRCVDCHDDPHQRQFEEAACEECHSSDGFTGRHLLFDHAALADYPLESSHRAVACAQCHRLPDGAPDSDAVLYRGLPHDCASCHDDPHQRQFEDTACESCHSIDGFTGGHLLFDHAALAGYPLESSHQRVACAQCHLSPDGTPDPIPTIYRGLPHDCASCHDDPHQRQFEDTSCESCHSIDGFTEPHLLFDHAALTAYPLESSHQRVACAECHRSPDGTPGSAPATYRGLSHDCASCHEGPHGEQFGETACRDCHSPAGFTGSHQLFDHSQKGAYPLEGPHGTAACIDCHLESSPPAPVSYRGLSRRCETCHPDAASFREGRIRGDGIEETWPPSPHDTVVTCTGCHDLKREPLSLPDRALACASCHTDRYADLQVARTAHARKLEVAIENALARLDDPDLVAQIRRRVTLLQRAADHNYVPAEKRLRGILDELGGRERKSPE